MQTTVMTRAQDLEERIAREKAREDALTLAQDWAYKVVHEQCKAIHAVYSVKNALACVSAHRKVFLDDTSFFRWANEQYKKGAKYIGAYHTRGAVPVNPYTLAEFLADNYGNNWYSTQSLKKFLNKSMIKTFPAAMCQSRNSGHGFDVRIYRMGIVTAQRHGAEYKVIVSKAF